MKGRGFVRLGVCGGALVLWGAACSPGTGGWGARQARRAPPYDASAPAARAPATASQRAQKALPAPRPSRAQGGDASTDGLIARAEAEAPEPARAVLITARRMIEQGAIVRGSCWDYANEVFARAGFPQSRGRRHTVFRGSRSRRNFASLDLVRPGDWLYYVNHSWNDSPHSAIFVGWVDRPRAIGLMITYRGSRRRVPGHYEPYDLSHVYRIIRPGSRADAGR